MSFAVYSQAYNSCVPPNEGWNYEFKVVNQYGGSIKTYNDGYGKLYVFRNEYGVIGVVLANREYGAYECMLDEFIVPVSSEDVHEAYNSYDKLLEFMISKGHENTQQLRRFCCKWDDWYFEVCTHNANDTGAWDDWSLGEGYEYQPNATDSGIVYVGDYLSMDELTDELASKLGLSVSWITDEWVDS